MKTKLLRKIRRRFNWYQGKKDLVLIDYKNKLAHNINEEYLLGKYPKFPKEEINEEILFFLLKQEMAQPFVKKYGARIRYNYANRRLKIRKPA